MRMALFGLVLAAGLLWLLPSVRGEEPQDAAADPAQAGSLIIVGGGGFPKEIADRFVELAGGEDALLVVIPTASANPKPDEQIITPWLRRGIGRCVVLHTTDRKVAESEAFVEPLREATAVWIGGGAQSRLADAYAGTAVERELIRLVQRGGVVGGSSAGAAIQSKTMIAKGDPVPEIRRGFDLIPGAIIDQHFLARDRMNRLLFAVNQHPDLMGIGIDEATAIEVQGRHCQVLGRSHVVLIQMEKADSLPRIQVLHAGQAFGLHGR